MFESDLLKGQFLVAARQLNDPNFYKTVVLIVEHSDEGAMGLVVNRPSSLNVATALSHEFDVGQSDDLVYVGGPVDQSALFMLHSGEDLDCCDRIVAPGIMTVADHDTFSSVIRSAHDGERPDLAYRIFHGCAGWAPEQLEGEVERGDWLTVPACPDATFFEDPYQVWDVSIARIFRANRLVPQLVQNPEWN